MSSKLETIWRFELKRGGINEIEMPKGARVLSAQFKHDQLNLWAIVDPIEPVEKEKRFFKVYVTGETGDFQGWKFIGTTQMAEFSLLPLVFHIFEKN